jgi:voltage-gated potassium channel
MFSGFGTLYADGRPCAILETTVMNNITKKLKHIALTIAAIILIGTVGFKLIGGPGVSFLTALYMTAITITTVGYGDVVGLYSPQAKLFAIMYMFLATGTILYLFTTLSAYVVEGELKKIFLRKSMERRVARMKDHFIVCGIGMVGLYIVHELYHTKRPQIVVDIDDTNIDKLKEHGFTVDMVVGDATENEVLEKAMIKTAKGLFATTNSDNDNIVIVLTAKQLNPDLRVVARCNDTKNIEKIRRAGADTVVALNYIGGLRMASEMLRPHVINLIDAMLRDRESHVRVEELHIPEHSPCVGKSISEADFRSVGNILVIAIREHHGQWIYNPTSDVVLEKGMHLIILATPEERALIQNVIEGEGC